MDHLLTPAGTGASPARTVDRWVVFYAAGDIVAGGESDTANSLDGAGEREEGIIHLFQPPAGPVRYSP
jgi:hypothetical protein